MLIMASMTATPPITGTAGTTTVEGVNTPVTGRLVAQVNVVGGILGVTWSNNSSETLSATRYTTPGSPLWQSVVGAANSPLFSRWNTVSGDTISSTHTENVWSRVVNGTNWGFDLTGFTRDATVDIDFALEGNTGLIYVTKRFRLWIHAA